jgi:hypothetical protein
VPTGAVHSGHDHLTAAAEQRLLELASTDCDARARHELMRWIREGSDLDCFKINAWRLAEAARTDGPAAVRTLLFATRLGVCDLNYDLLL